MVTGRVKDAHRHKTGHWPCMGRQSPGHAMSHAQRRLAVSAVDLDMWLLQSLGSGGTLDMKLNIQYLAMQPPSVHRSAGSMLLLTFIQALRG